MVWYSHLLKHFSQFVVIHAVKSFGIVNEAEVDIFLELSCFFNNLTDIENNIWTPRGKERGRKWEVGIDIYTLLLICIKDITNENLLYSTGSFT